MCQHSLPNCLNLFLGSSRCQCQLLRKSSKVWLYEFKQGSRKKKVFTFTNSGKTNSTIKRICPNSVFFFCLFVTLIVLAYSTKPKIITTSLNPKIFFFFVQFLKSCFKVCNFCYFCYLADSKRIIHPKLIFHLFTTHHFEDSGSGDSF